MKRTGFSQVLSSMTQDATARLCPVEIADFIPIASDGPAIARVILTTDQRDYDETEIATAFAERNDNKLRLVQDSVAKVTTVNRRSFYTALALLNRTSVDYKDNIGKMTCLSSSTFLDDKSQIWTVEGDGDSKRLFINCDDNLTEVLAARRKYAPVPEHASSAVVPNTHYAMYYSPSKGRYEFGFPINTDKGLVMVNRNEEVASVIDPQLVVASEYFDNDEMRVTFENPLTEVAASAASKLIAYYRKCFKDTTFFINFEAAIRKSGKA